MAWFPLTYSIIPLDPLEPCAYGMIFKHMGPSTGTVWLINSSKKSPKSSRTTDFSAFSGTIEDVVSVTNFHSSSPSASSLTSLRLKWPSRSNLHVAGNTSNSPSTRSNENRTLHEANRASRLFKGRSDRIPAVWKKPSTQEREGDPKISKPNFHWSLQKSYHWKKPLGVACSIVDMRKMVLLEENRCCLTACGSGKIRLLLLPNQNKWKKWFRNIKKKNNNVKITCQKSPTKQQVSSEVTSYFNLISWCRLFFGCLKASRLHRWEPKKTLTFHEILVV